MRKEALQAALAAMLLAATCSAVSPRAQASAAPMPISTTMIDPDLALLPVGAASKVTIAQAHADRDARGKLRAAQQRLQRAASAPKAYAEKEPVGVSGRNDAVATAETIPNFGTARGKNPKAAISGDLAEGDITTLPQAAEDNGAVPLAADTGLTGTRDAVRIPGVIGDGPHGSGGDGHGDFDFYKVSGMSAGASLVIDVTADAALNATILLVDQTGAIVLYADDPTSGSISRTFPLPAGGDWYVVVAGFGSFPGNTQDPAGGSGAGSEGGYTLKLDQGLKADNDVYAVDLKAGDVLGATANGNGHVLSLYDPAGTELQTSSLDASGSYAPASPLPGGGNATVDLVAPKAGRYFLAVRSGSGPYSVTVEAYRPGTETERAGTVQTLFLDFNGARVNTSIFGGNGAQRDLSPLSAFLPGWGLTKADENRVIDATIASVKENMSRDLAARGTNPNFALRILNSRDDPDPFGKPDVSRVVIGGTVAESGITTIGIAQSIDPGNFGHEETALLLLDYVSRPAPDPNSYNTFAAPGADKAAFVGRSLGNYASHEAGHFSGSWHTDETNTVANLMDQGGNPTQMVGVGADGLGGTADDVDVDFTGDALQYPFAGQEDTLNRTAWAYSRGLG